MLHRTSLPKNGQQDFSTDHGQAMVSQQIGGPRGNAKWQTGTSEIR